MLSDAGSELVVMRNVIDVQLAERAQAEDTQRQQNADDVKVRQCRAASQIREEHVRHGRTAANGTHADPVTAERDGARHRSDREQTERDEKSRRAVEKQIIGVDFTHFHLADLDARSHGDAGSVREEPTFGLHRFLC